MNEAKDRIKILFEQLEDQTSKSPSLEEVKPVMRPDTDEQTQQQVISWADEVDKEFPLESS